MSTEITRGKIVSESSATKDHQANTSNQAKEPPITAGEMLKQLIAGGYIVPPTFGYTQPTLPSAYMVVPNITSAHSILTPMRSEDN